MKKVIVVDGQEYDIARYSFLESFIDHNFEDKDLSTITIEDFFGVPDTLCNNVSIPCTLEEALVDNVKNFDSIFDWACYVEDNPREEDATEAFLEISWGWDKEDFEDNYDGYWESKEEYAEEYVDETGYGTYLSNFIDYNALGEQLYEDLNLAEYTPSALNDYRRELGLPPLEEDEEDNLLTKKELEMKYGFIGDDEGEEEENTFDDNSDTDLTEAQEEYNRFVEENSFEIRLAPLSYYEIAEEYIDSYGNIEDFMRNFPNIINYIDLEDFFDNYLGYDFVDGYVFRNY